MPCLCKCLHTPLAHVFVLCAPYFKLNVDMLPASCCILWKQPAARAPHAKTRSW